MSVKKGKKENMDQMTGISNTVKDISNVVKEYPPINISKKE